MSKHSGFELVGDIIPDEDNSRDLGSSSKRFANIHAVRIHNEGLRYFAVALYGMTPDFLQYSQNVYGSTRLAFQFRLATDYTWQGVRLPLQYVGTPPNLVFDLYHWNGTSWEYLDSVQVSTSDCGSSATGSPTFVTSLTGLINQLNAGDLYEIRVHCQNGDGSNYWRLYYDEVTYRDWKGRDCVGFKISTDGGSNWTDYEDRELSVQVLVGVDA
ncbi:MAG: hypothetical protein DRP63_03910 [Planctomycetota bacterium]|nr:MAG: hypothetical protein DRP63_03910 [Planctomycetota bacterium]